MKEIEKITKSVEYIAYHLCEYKDTPKATNWLLQDYLDKAWELVKNHEATEVEALHIRDLGRLVNMILDSSENILF